LVAAVADAFAAGWVVGHRDSRGLRPPRYSASDRGRGYGAAEAARIGSLPDAERRKALLREATRGGLVVVWELVKQRGRLPSEQRRLAVGVASGALRGLVGRPGSGTKA
jgi:hypothetical protein